MNKTRSVIDGKPKREYSNGQKKKYYFTTKRVNCRECGKEIPSNSVPSHYKLHRNMEKAGFFTIEEYYRYKKRNNHDRDSHFKKLGIKRKCIICDESIAVSIHHHDGNHDNDEQNNLVPLCLNHHSYLHSRYAKLIQDDVNKYVQSLFSVV